MYQIDNATASPTAPTDSAIGPNPGGHFTSGNPAVGQAATVVDDYFLEMLQAELANVLSVAGVPQVKANNAQLVQSLKRIFGGNRTLVTASASLGPDNAGLVVVNANGGNVVLTLPLNSSANGAPLEYVFMRSDLSANIVTVTYSGGDVDRPANATSQLVVPGFPLWLHGDGASIWDVVLASNGGFLKAANNLSDVASLATALTNLSFASDGATYFKIPNPSNPAKPWIVQMGSQTGSAGGFSVVFPITFPNALIGIFSQDIALGNNVLGVLGMTAKSVSGFSGYMNNGTGSTHVGDSLYWLAIGN